MYNSTTQSATTQSASVHPALRLCGELYQSRLAQTEIVKAAVLARGEAETEARMIAVDGGAALAVIVAHAAGLVVRFTTLRGGEFVVRELTILPSQERGYDVWLTVDGRTFPHRGKYMAAAHYLLLTACADY